MTAEWKQKQPLPRFNMELPLLLEYIQPSAQNNNQFQRVNRPHRMTAVSARNKTSGGKKMRSWNIRHVRFLLFFYYFTPLSFFCKPVYNKRSKVSPTKGVLE